MSTAVAEAAPASVLKNYTFDELDVGDCASLVRIVGRDDIDLFAAVSGDVNPAHLDATFAATDLFGHVVAHGMWTAALVSAVLGTKLPGPGTIYLGQDLRFLKPVAPGDTITVTVRVKEKRPEKRIVLLDTSCTNQSGKEVLSGTATVIAPTNRIEWPRSTLPKVRLRRQDDELIDEARARAPERRLVTIEDIGAMAAGLVSDFARNVTGSIAYVDAGYHVMS